MSEHMLVGGTITAAGYLLLISVIALIASAHSDEKRRRDAARILDRLLRVRDRERS